MCIRDSTPYGLGASIWSQNISQVHRLIPRLQAGMVWENTNNMLDPALPLGGLKQSGYGRDVEKASVESYTEVKSVGIALEGHLGSQNQDTQLGRLPK